MKITFVVPGPPKGKARHRTTRSGHTYNPESNKKNEAMIKAQYLHAAGGILPHVGGVIVDILAMYTPPKSWSKKKRANPGPKLSKPDCDNIEKLCLDALNKVAWSDDARVVDVRIRKQYGDRDELVVCLERIGE